MLKVFAIQSKQRQEELCRLCGIEYDADLLAYVAEVDGIVAGICQFKTGPEGGSIRHLAPATDRACDKQAIFVLGRATLNFIDLCGIHFARYDGDPATVGEQMLHAIGFHLDDTGVWSVDLTDFFKSPCQHDHGMPENH